MAMQQYDVGLQTLQKRNQLAQQIFGLESEQYCEFLEEEVIFTFQLGRADLCLPLIQKLIRTLKEIHGGENNQKILSQYEHLYQLLFGTQQYAEALQIVQKKISIYKALNGAEIADWKIQDYLLEMAVVNVKLNKFEDSERNCTEAEKIQKKIPQSDPEWKKKEEEVKKLREELNKLKKVGDAGAVKATENKKP